MWAKDSQFPVDRDLVLKDEDPPLGVKGQVIHDLATESSDLSLQNHRDRVAWLLTGPRWVQKLKRSVSSFSSDTFRILRRRISADLESEALLGSTAEPGSDGPIG